MKPALYLYSSQRLESSQAKRKLITAEACAEIIRYYADQYTAKNGKAVPLYPIARESLNKFASHGIDKFIKQMAGYQEIQIQVYREDSRILQLVQLLVQKVDALETKISNFGKVEIQYPGIQIINNQVQNIVFLPPDLEQPFTIREWVLKMKSRRLTRNECISLGRHVANSLTTLKLESPEKYGSASIYRYEDIPGLMSAWEGWTKTRHR